MPEKTLLDKLLLKPGVSFALLNAPAGHKAPDGARVIARGDADAVLLYVTTSAELEKGFSSAIARLAPSGRLWIAYPKAGKLGTDLNRNSLARAVRGHSFDAVSQVAIDDTWSALWFKPLD